MKHILYLILATAACVPLRCLAGSHDAPRYFFFDGRAMQKMKRAYEANDPDAVRKIKSLVKAAEAGLKKGPFSVMRKKKTPASGDKHDYYSIAPYYWPDPKTADGLPYIRKDGQTNPASETEDYDFVSLRALDTTLNELVLAWYFAGRREFGEHAARLTRAWFLDPATRMNPHGQHAQAISGLNTGRSAGIIEFYKFVEMLDPLLLLMQGGFLNAQEEAGLRQWFGSLKAWLAGGEFGKRELPQPNNHGVWCRVQLACYAIFSGDAALARRLIDETLTANIAAQIRDDGTLPAELARTRPLHYVLYALTAFVRLAQLGEQFCAVRYFDETHECGRRLRKALAWALPYARGEKEMDGAHVLSRDRTAHQESAAMLVYRVAAIRLHMPEYGALFDELVKTKKWELNDLTLP